MYTDGPVNYAKQCDLRTGARQGKTVVKLEVQQYLLGYREYW